MSHNEFSNWFSEYNTTEANKLMLPKIYKTGKIKFIRNVKQDQERTTIDQQHLPFGSSNSFSAVATLQSRFYHPDGKEILLLDLQAQELKSLPYEPGDTIGILPKNSETTIINILNQLNVDNSDELIEIENNDAKKQYLPKTTTIRNLLTCYVNFKCLPMKQMLITLADYASDPREKSALKFLSSKEGAETYKSVILDGGLSVDTVLTKFTSCRPPVELLIEILPRLLPRPYSLASSKSVFPSQIKIALSVLPFEREGLCTGMLRKAFLNADQSRVDMYLRKPNGFRLPVDNTIPLILVGPGTGVAPFLGFLEEIKYKNNKRIVYLFTGFQYKESYFCMREVEDHFDSGLITKLFVSFSREEDGPKYVQDNIKDNWKELGDLIVNNKACVYECGDFKKMSETIYDAFIKVLSSFLDVNLEEAKKQLDAIKTEGRYLQDIWC